MLQCIAPKPSAPSRLPLLRRGPRRTLVPLFGITAELALCLKHGPAKQAPAGAQGCRGPATVAEQEAEHSRLDKEGLSLMSCCAWGRVLLAMGCPRRRSWLLSAPTMSQLEAKREKRRFVTKFKRQLRREQKADSKVCIMRRAPYSQR